MSVKTCANLISPTNRCANRSTKGVHWGLHLSNERKTLSIWHLYLNENATWSVFTECAKYRKEKMQIYLLNTSIAIYQAWKWCKWLQFASVFNPYTSRLRTPSAGGMRGGKPGPQVDWTGRLSVNRASRGLGEILGVRCAPTHKYIYTLSLSHTHTHTHTHTRLKNSGRCITS